MKRFTWSHLMSILKPWYLCRPRQLLIRAFRTMKDGEPGTRSVRLPWGCEITVDTSKMIGRSIWTTGVFDLAVSEVLARLICPGDLILDVGANVGYMSILMGLCAGRSGELICFEPHPALYKSLRDNLTEVQRQSPFPKTDLHNAALSDTAGEGVLMIPQGFDDNDGIASLSRRDDRPMESIPVATETLDGVLEKRTAAVMKIDVEGHELVVLHGAAEVIRQARIRHIVYEDHEGPSSAVSSLLRRNGYTLLQIGWSLLGPRLASVESAPICKPYEAPSYLATLDLDFALRACQGRGWRVLGSLQIPAAGKD